MVGRNITEGLKSSHEILAPARKEMDLSHWDSTLGYLQKNKPEMVIHCAGRVGGIQANMAHPVEFLIENIDITRNLIKAAQNVGVKKLINMASSCVYPRGFETPLTEDLILKGELEPTNEGYAIAKIFALRLCQYIHREDQNFQYKTLVPCNLYGPYDKFDPKISHLLPSIILKIDRAIREKREQVEIWGDGEARREFMYVGDLVDCVKKAITDFESLPDVMNVGLGKDWTINEYYKAVSEVMEYNGKFKHDLSKPTGMKRKLVDVSKARAWGWQSEISLSQGISNTLKYYRERI